MPQEKVRVYALARELHMESKDLLDLCHQAGLDIKNQLSGLDAEQRAAVEQLVKRHQGATGSPPAAARTGSTALPRVEKPIPILDTRRPRTLTGPSHSLSPPAPVAPVEPPPAAHVVRPAEVPPPSPAAPEAPAAEAPVQEVSAPAPQPHEAAPPAVPHTPAAAGPSRPAVPPRAPEAERPAPPTPPPAAIPSAPAAQTTSPADGGGVRRPLPIPGTRRIPDLKPREGGGSTPRRPGPSIRPTGTSYASGASAPPKPRGLGDKVKKPPEPPTQKPLHVFTKDQLAVAARGPITPEALIREQQKKPPTGAPGEVVPPSTEEESEEGKKVGSKAGKGHGPGLVGDRNQRRSAREKRAQERKAQGGVAVVNEGGRVVVLEQEERHTKDRRKGGKRGQMVQRPKGGHVSIAPPITVRSLCETLGLKSVDLLFKLQAHGVAKPSINSTLEQTMAEEIALEAGFELEVKRPADAEDDLLASYETPDSPDDLRPRAPVVTIMGHVDHGKTSLLDKIRSTNVVATEAGGITQVIRAWRVQHNGRPITFLDTPGHEAFTKMRARGAQVTDIAVIVVAADDGVMPQTEEAINHAKAAKVSLVVAINKVDMPSANVNRTRQQLYGLNVLPDNMGGDTPFVETSAATGKGIDDLLEAITLVAELKELKANPNKPGKGTVLEAMLSEGEGVRATLLVQEGTLHRGDVILCGASYGRVRQLYDDMGHPIQEAGPSVPVRITGLDEVPNADDPFLVVSDLATARGIAENRKSRQQEAALVKRVPMSLERLTETKIIELKVILKADFRGSIEAIRKELEKLHHEEVRVRLLHAAIGGITESDVQLALTSPEDTLIVGFNVVPDERARALAEEKGIKIREYDIIYNLTNDVRAALEGKLKPREEVIHLGRAVVRETFKISRVGTIAGCYVTQGVIKRSGKIRVIREGVVIYPPADRTAGLESLKRFKDDASEVREGFECGVKIAGYDDIKVGDVIEAYRVEEVQRTLET